MNKKRFSLVFFLLFLMKLSPAQDVITNKNGDEIKAKVIEVGQTEIKYKKFTNLTGPIFTVSKSDVFMIKYENGEKEVFNSETKKNNVTPTVTLSNEDEMYMKGKEDALVNYKGKNSGDLPTLAITLLTSPLIGLIPAAIITSNEPSNENLNYPSSQLMKNNSYNKGYTEQATKIKKKKVWSAFGIGSAVWLFVALIISSR
jgi:hypothetical protein